MNVGIAQFNPRFGDKKYNLQMIDRLAQQAKADVLVFPEMCTTGYIIRTKTELKQLAEPIPHGPTIKILEDIAARMKGVLVVGLPEVQSNKFYISVVAVGPRGFITKQQKTHLFLREKLFFTPGRTKPHLFSWRNANIGLGICYDYMFPEFWRTLALQGADLFCNSANFVYDYGLTVMRTRALENGVFSICCNRVGTEHGQVFRGGSEIVDPRGQIIRKAASRERVITASIDLKDARNKKWNPYNHLLSDRRPTFYSL